MDERGADDCWPTRARSVIAGRRRERRTALAEALAVVTRHLREARFRRADGRDRREPGRLRAVIEAHGSAAAAVAAMRGALGSVAA